VAHGSLIGGTQWMALLSKEWRSNGRDREEGRREHGKAAGAKLRKVRKMTGP